jgi:ABC-type transport system involved in cytochrome c biogenesis permease component
MMGYRCANTALAGLACMLVVRRENGLLKRVRATPLPAATYLTAVLVSTLFVFLLQMVVTVALGVTLYGARGAESWAALVPVLLLGAAAFAALGIGLAAVIRRRGRLGRRQPRRPAHGVPLRLFRPDEDYPDVLQAVADVLR